MSDNSDMVEATRIENDARRRFLRRCGKFAAVTPPVITLMLTMSDRGYAQFQSGGNGVGPIGPPGGIGPGPVGSPGDDDGHTRPHGDNGFGNGGHDGVPGRSRHSDDDR